MLSALKRGLSQSALTRTGYYQLYKWRQQRREKIRRRRMQEVGYPILERTCQLLQNEGYTCCCAYGTLLGFIRDKAFISYDPDIDLILLDENVDFDRLAQVLTEQGAKVTDRFSFEDKVCEISIDWSGIKIDIFQAYRLDGKEGGLFLVREDDVVYDNDRQRSAIHVATPATAGIEQVELEGHHFPIPTNAKDILSAIYTPGWETPDNKWDGSGLSNRTTMPTYALHLP